MNQIKFTLISAILFLLSSCQNNEIKKDIESKINSLHSKQESIYTISLENNIFSKALTQKIENLRKLTIEDTERIKNSNSPSDKPMMLEGSAFTSLYDGFQKYTIKEVKIKDKTAEVTVEFEYNHSTPKVTWIDKVILINENGWKIDEIEFDTKLSMDINLTNRLTNTSYFKDIDGNELKLVYGKENDTANVTFTFKGETVVLKQTISASGVRYTDINEQFQLDEKGQSVTLSKNDTIIFSAPEKFLDFTEAKNYFLKNDYPEKELHSVKIASEADLNKIFGAATTMGKNGAPTKIDFTKYYVIALIGKTNNEANEIAVSSAIKLDKTITITVFINPKEEGKKQSYSSRPFKILILEKKYQGEIKIDSF